MSGAKKSHIAINRNETHRSKSSCFGPIIYTVAPFAMSVVLIISPMPCVAPPGTKAVKHQCLHNAPGKSEYWIWSEKRQERTVPPPVTTATIPRRSKMFLAVRWSSIASAIMERMFIDSRFLRRYGQIGV